MNNTATFDSFQIIIGIFFLYAAVKGKGTMYNFFDLSEKMQVAVKPKLRILYGVCALLALGEGGLCMWAASSGQTALSTQTVTSISTGMTICIILILAGIFIWMRKLAAQGNK